MIAEEREPAEAASVVRAPLQRDQIIQLALAIADREGVDAVSFRRLAADLGVTPMALYRHVRDKADLLTGMADAILAELEVKLDPGTPWNDQLRELMRAFGRLLLAHPGAASLLAATSAPRAMGIAEIAMDILVRAGFSPAEAIAIVQHLSMFVIARSAVERLGKASSREMDLAAETQQTRAEIEALPAEEFPHLRAAAPYVEVWGGPVLDWEFGTELLVAGVEALLARKQAAESGKE